MAYRELFLRGHIYASVNGIDQNGEPFVHVLLSDDAAGQALVDTAAGVGTVFDSKTQEFDRDCPPEFKRKNGEPIHVFGDDARMRAPVIVEEAPEPT
jgi:hypothetical protein